MNYGYEDYYYENLNPNDKARLLRIAENFNNTYGSYPLQTRTPLTLYNADRPQTLRNLAEGIGMYRGLGYIPQNELGLQQGYLYY